MKLGLKGLRGKVFALACGAVVLCAASGAALAQNPWLNARRQAMHEQQRAERRAYRERWRDERSAYGNNAYQRERWRELHERQRAQRMALRNSYLYNNTRRVYVVNGRRYYIVNGRRVYYR